MRRGHAVDVSRGTTHLVVGILVQREEEEEEEEEGLAC